MTRVLQQTPARLHVILARDAPRAVIVRRGPAKWVRLILWHTDTDTFTGGQWLRGRIYAERCALSPDGSLLLYFAAQHHKFGNGYRGTWSAISRPPYLTALALWPKGDTWGGGGVFVDNRTVYLYHCGPADAHPDHVPPKRLRVVTDSEQLTGRDRAALDRIRAGGWQLIHEPKYVRNMVGVQPDDPVIWHHAHPADDRYTLIKRYFGYLPDHYPGPAIVDFALHDAANDSQTLLAGANWADWDQRGRLIYARDGQVFAGDAARTGEFARPLADFNDQAFEDVPAPGWARRW